MDMEYRIFIPYLLNGRSLITIINLCQTSFRLLNGNVIFYLSILFGSNGVFICLFYYQVLYNNK